MVTALRVPDLHGARTRRAGGPLAAAATMAAAALALRVRDPHQHGSWGLCPFKAITGWDCPLCGGLRSVNDLTHGHFADAAHSNLLLVATLPVIAALWLLWLQRSWTASSRQLPAGLVRAALVAGGVLLVGFAVYRNTPWGAAWHVA
jgi:hypothetical protein